MTDATLTSHPAAADLRCGDCRANIVQIGGHREGWYWFQCPHCGLYIQTDNAGIGLSATRNRSEVRGLGERLHPDVFTPAAGTIVTYATRERCAACLGLYPARVTRTWEAPRGRTTLTERVESERLPGEVGPSWLDGRAIAPCRCAGIAEESAALDALLARLEAAGHALRLRHSPSHPDVPYIFRERRPYPAAEVRAILTEGTATEPPRPDLLAAPMRLAWSDDARCGALYPAGDGWWLATVQAETGGGEA